MSTGVRKDKSIVIFGLFGNISGIHCFLSGWSLVFEPSDWFLRESLLAKDVFINPNPFLRPTAGESVSPSHSKYMHSNSQENHVPMP